MFHAYLLLFLNSSLLIFVVAEIRIEEIEDSSSFFFFFYEFMLFNLYTCYVESSGSVLIFENFVSSRAWMLVLEI